MLSEEPQKNKIYFYTFGCKVNQYDTQQIKEKSLHTGLLEETNDLSQADLILINTCTVTAESDRQCRQMARRFLRSSKPTTKIIFYGCYVRRAKGDIGGKDTFIESYQNDERIIFASSIDEAVRELTAFENINNIPLLASSPAFITTFGKERSRAYVKIQDGCDQFCSYCIVPYVRNNMVSRRPEEIMSEVRTLVNNGYYEIVLCGVRLGKYNPSPDYHLEDIVEDLLKIKNNFRIRFSSIELKEITPRLVEIMKINPSRICRHLHIPLQSGSDAILKKMNRPYTSDEYVTKVLSLKKELAPLAITTDVIIGFPTETQEDFEATLSVARKVGFSKLHIFPYSVRPGTLAASKFEFRKDAVYLKNLARRKKIIFELDKELQKKWRAESLKRKHIAIYIGDGWVLTEDYQYYKLSSDAEPPQGLFDFIPMRSVEG